MLVCTCISIYEQIIYKYIQIYYYKNKHVIIMSTETLTINIDKDLKTELKVIAIRKHVTVTDILTDLIQVFVNENK